jgi:sigma-B regulation protein RsbU (phosphoserine phosphatase)
MAMEGNRLALCLGDVSGKGLPAALLMANLQATIRAQTRLNLAPKVCLQYTNMHLYQSTDRSKFATLFYGILDHQTGRLVFANAGHNRPFYFTGDERPRMIESAGLALSIVEDVAYPEGTLTFEPGDLLLLYSDGITEAMNAQNEEYGEQRLTETAGKYRDLSAHLLLNKIIESVRQFAGKAPQADDMTMIVLKRVN